MIPIVDLCADDAPRLAAEACLAHGFFYVAGHGIDAAHVDELERTARRFFAQPHESKMAIEMAHGGAAWRGYFPVGAELTSGQPDQKEGLYFGEEMSAADPKFGQPLCGANLFADDDMRRVVLRHLDLMTTLGHRLIALVARSLDLPPTYFVDRYTADPLILFRIFHYPPLADPTKQWSVGAHTDYGLLTILLQDDTAGLEVQTPSGWIEAPPIPGTFVVNLGDMLDRLTGGVYRSTLHRVRNVSDRGRLSFPFFFDPALSARIEPLPNTAVVDDDNTRWDAESVRLFSGTYETYLKKKIARVFPTLAEF